MLGETTSTSFKNWTVYKDKENDPKVLLRGFVD